MARDLGTGPADEFRYEASPRWLRARIGDTVVADSRRAILVWEPRRVLPVYCFPREDLRDDLLAPAQTPEGQESVRAATHALAFDGRTVADGAWSYSDPDLEGYVALRWDAVDAWFEEDERVFVHPRDPHHRVDVLRSSRHVLVTVDGQAVAESRRPHLLFETGLPARYYLPDADVARELLEPSETVTACPYKGIASYWSLRTPRGLHADVVWSYRDPVAEMPKIAGLLCFFDERVDVLVDGRAQSRPRTQWS